MRVFLFFFFIPYFIIFRLGRKRDKHKSHQPWEGPREQRWTKFRAVGRQHYAILPHHERDHDAGDLDRPLLQAVDDPHLLEEEAGDTGHSRSSRRGSVS